MVARKNVPRAISDDNRGTVMKVDRPQTVEGRPSGAQIVCRELAAQGELIVGERLAELGATIAGYGQKWCAVGWPLARGGQYRFGRQDNVSCCRRASQR